MTDESQTDTSPSTSAGIFPSGLIRRYSGLVLPGITGLWQVSGRSDLSYQERVRLDMYYVRNYSIWMDFQILFIKTARAVLRAEGAY